jgi:L-seryl-tRNA(Ser) seleniumtransferase
VPDREELLRALPSVHVLTERISARFPQVPRIVVAEEVRRVLESARSDIRGERSGEALDSAVEQRIERRLASVQRPSLRRVINATGVVLHTNLGRAPLGRAVEPVPGYSNLEYDLASGKRGKRDVHTAGLFERLIGAPAIAVNNNAAAVFLALNEFAAGYEVVVSRGELIEIGDGFRIPDIMRLSGAVLREVGTTNRTRISDYREAINDRTRLLLRVHPSNFRMEGFASRVGAQELAALGRERNVPVYEDLGSGCLTDLRPFGIDEPLVPDSLRAGVDLVSFSGDKLLGGPQAGILAGNAELVARLRRNPLFRALRVDKLITQALEATLKNIVLERWDRIPALLMIRQSAEHIRDRAERLLPKFHGVTVRIESGESVIGGGSTPQQRIPTWLIRCEHDDIVGLESRLRAAEPPVIARIEAGAVLLDLRTVFPEEEEMLAGAVSRSASPEI